MGCSDDGGDDNNTPFNGIKFTSAGSLTLSLNHLVDGKILTYAPDSFVLSGGDTLKVTKLSYYISNITLESETGQKTNLGTYHLVDESVPASKMITVGNIPAGVYKKVSFLLGVDTIRNHTGAQDGALDPAYGMFWTWNTGYIFYRLKGRVGLAATSISYDIGGDGNAITFTNDLSSYKVEGTKATLNYQMNIAEVFKGPNPIIIQNEPKEIHSNTETVLLPRMVQNMKDIFMLSSVN